MSGAEDRLIRCLVRNDSGVTSAPLAPGLVRAEALLLAGNFLGALKALPSAGGAQAAFLEGAARLALGNVAGAEKAAARAGGEPALKAAIRALAAAHGGHCDLSEKQLELAARLRPRRAWPFVLMASVRELFRDFAGADRALGLASQREARAWIHAERARVREYLGCLPDAIASAASAIALEPSAAHHRLKGDLHERWREHRLASEEYAEALRLTPDDASLAFLWARVLSAAGLFDRARVAAVRTEKLAPAEAAYRDWRVQLDIISGNERRAERELKGMLAAPGAGATAISQARFLLSYLEMRRRRWSKAREGFDALWRKAEAGAFARKASFYAAVCRALEDGGPKRVDARLVLAGLGVDPPYTATAESLRVIAAADTVFNNVMGDEMFEFLRALCPDVRAVAYHQCGDEPALSDLMMAEARPGHTAVFVTRGNALVYGPLGTEMLRRCRKKGVSWLCLEGVSSMESIHARLGCDASMQLGGAVIDSAFLKPGTETDPRAALTAYLSFDRGGALYQRFCATAAAARGADAPCAVYDHVIGQEPLAWRIRDLAGKREALTCSAIAHFPPVRRA